MRFFAPRMQIVLALVLVLGFEHEHEHEHEHGSRGFMETRPADPRVSRTKGCRAFLTQSD